MIAKKFLKFFKSLNMNIKTNFLNTRTLFRDSFYVYECLKYLRQLMCKLNLLKA
jgi:hypothetical protein